VEVNCSAIPDTLLENEHFGFERGIFTDAKRTKKGLMEVANGGTLFLDEIGEMSVSLQSKLLRALDQKRFRRLGGTSDIIVETRIVAATNKDLKTLVQQEKFREDLYFRLNVIQIQVPPLRERPEDIPPLIDHFVGMWNRDLGRDVKGPNDRALELLLAYRWPGNVRELKNIIERAVYRETDGELTAADLEFPSAGTGEPTGSFESRIEALERELIDDALGRAGGNQAQAARLLGLSYHQFRYFHAKHFGKRGKKS
jgi:transcriptional regulator with PAS, ATPase and Fis domain